MRKIEIDMADLFDLVSAAEDYGYDDDVFMVSAFRWVEPITDAEIEEFSRLQVDGEGTTEEDYEETKTRLTEWRDKYTKK